MTEMVELMEIESDMAKALYEEAGIARSRAAA